MVRTFSFVAMILAVAGPVAAQPDSRSMARCAGLLEAVQIVVPEHENIAKIEAAAAAFAAAASAAAGAEGIAAPAAFVAEHQATMRAQWQQHGGLALFSQDFVDQIALCRPMADAHGIDMNFD